jgi:fumarylacetoacetase
MDKTNHASYTSWIDVAKENDFPIQNLPFGIIKSDDGIRLASRIGDYAIDLLALFDLGYLSDIDDINREIFASRSLNLFISKDRKVARAVRLKLFELFESSNNELKKNTLNRGKIVIPINKVETLLPVEIGDYTDFYSSIEHATNVGMMFRDPENALLPNWKHLPVGYHGRSSSIVVSGTNIHRPKGQIKPNNQDGPIFSPTRLLDFELEMAFITCNENKLGNPIPIDQTDDYIFGLVLFNDLSARDIQKWEYVPLGPFLAKNFGSVISPWIVTMDALEPFKVHGPVQVPEVLPYLKIKGAKNFDINLEVFIQPENKEPFKLCHSNFKYMYWNMNQQLAHQTVNGCNVRVGDMYASGTISGPGPDSYGSMLELSWQGTKPIVFPDGTERKFVADNDTIIIKGFAEKEGLRIGFGDCITRILPAK